MPSLTKPLLTTPRLDSTPFHSDHANLALLSFQLFHFQIGIWRDDAASRSPQRWAWRSVRLKFGFKIVAWNGKRSTTSRASTTRPSRSTRRARTTKITVWRHHPRITVTIATVTANNTSNSNSINISIYHQAARSRWRSSPNAAKVKTTSPTRVKSSPSRQPNCLW